MSGNLNSGAASDLFRFMLLFGIYKFSILNEDAGTINARIAWQEVDEDGNEEGQDIEWDIQDIENLPDALRLAEFIRDKRLIASDRIVVDPEELSSQFSQETAWSAGRTKRAIDALLNIRVDMLDDGRKSDYLFVHF